MTAYDASITAPGGGSAHFPEGRLAFFAIKEGIKAGGLRGEQTDHLTWRAQMTRGEIEALLKALFGPEGAYETKHAGVLGHMAARMGELRAFVAGLPDGHAFSVTVDEF